MQVRVVIPLPHFIVLINSSMHTLYMHVAMQFLLYVGKEELMEEVKEFVVSSVESKNQTSRTEEQHSR